MDKGFVKIQGIAKKVALSSRFWQRKMDAYEALKVEIEALKLHVKNIGYEGTQKV